MVKPFVLATSATVATLLAAPALASPVFLQESASFKTPDSSFEYFARHVAIDGDDALVLGEHLDAGTGGNQRRAALWYRKSGSAWVYKGKLADVTVPDDQVSPALALRGGVAGFIGDKLRLFEWNGTTFAPATVTGNANGPYLVIDAGRVLGSDTSTCEWDANLFTKAGNAWSATAHFDGPFFGCRDRMPGSPLAMQASEILVGVPYTDIYPDPATWPQVALFSYLGGGGSHSPYYLLPPYGEKVSAWGKDIATWGGNHFVAGSKDIGIAHIVWGADYPLPDGWFRPLDTYMTNDTRAVRVTHDYVFQNTWNYDRGAWVVNVFRNDRNNSGRGEHVAVLVGRNGASLGTRMDASGNRVIVSGNNGYTGDNTAHVFELPTTFATTPPTLQDHFEDGDAAGWSTIPGSQFAIVQDYRTRRWRQSSVAGYAGAVLAGSDRTVQGVQADVIRRSTDGTDRWMGVMSRYTDGANYYVAGLRDTNRVELRKNVNGTFTLLASAALPVSPNRAYRLQLVSNGNLHQVYVDGRKVLQAIDASHAHGLAGIRTYKTAADFDNVVATGRAHTTIYRADFSNEWLADCCTRGQWVRGTFRAGQLSQRSLDGLAITNEGPVTDDQAIQARITPDAFGTPPSGETAWFGLWARQYFLAVGSDDRMRLLKQLPSGAWTVLKTITFTTPTTQREYRLEVVGDRIRAFVDGVPKIEAEETQPVPASYSDGRGLVTWYAQASFDELQIYQP